MRRLQPKPKERRRVPIPSELREALREVFDLIERAKTDPDIELGFDDAIQVGPVLGGRVGRKPRPYALAYYPTGGTARDRWYLHLHRTDIEDIADGRLTELTLHCCTAADCRCKFREADDRCLHCDFVDDPNYGTFAFPAAAARLTAHGVTGLSADSTRDDVAAALGPPDATGGGVKHPPLGYIWPWVVYRRADCQLRFEFDKTGRRIRKVTVMEKNWEPGA